MIAAPTNNLIPFNLVPKFDDDPPPCFDAEQLRYARELLLTEMDIDTIAGMGLVLCDEVEALLKHAKRVDTNQ